MFDFKSVVAPEKKNSDERGRDFVAYVWWTKTSCCRSEKQEGVNSNHRIKKCTLCPYGVFPQFRYMHIMEEGFHAHVLFLSFPETSNWLYNGICPLAVTWVAYIWVWFSPVISMSILPLLYDFDCDSYLVVLLWWFTEEGGFTYGFAIVLLTICGLLHIIFTLQLWRSIVLLKFIVRKPLCDSYEWKAA